MCGCPLHVVSWSFCLFGMVFVTMSTGSLLNSECNWSGSFRAVENEIANVHDIQFRCLSGFLNWNARKSGLRVTFKAPPGYGNAKFQVCFLLQSKELNTFHEQAMGLKVLRSKFSGDDMSPLCVQSERDEVVLYFDAPHAVTGSLRLNYEVEVERGGLPTTQTRKTHCTQEELTEAFCHSDFAVEGVIRTFSNDADYKSRQVDVIPSHIYHQSAKIFRQNADLTLKMGVLTVPWNYNIDTRHKYVLIGNMTKEYGAYVSCHAKHRHWKEVLPTLSCK